MFRDSKGYIYMLFTNRDYAKAVTTKAILNVLQHPTEMLNLETGKWKLLTQAALKRRRNHL